MQPRGPCLGHSGRYKAGQLLVGKLRRQVSRQHFALGPLGRRLVGPPAASKASAASRRFFASRVSTLSTSSSDSSCTAEPETSSLVIAVSAIRSVRSRT